MNGRKAPSEVARTEAYGRLLPIAALLMVIIIGVVLTFLFYRSATAGQASVDQRQLSDAGGLSAFVSNDETMEISSVSISMGAAADASDPFMGDADALADLADQAVAVRLTVEVDESLALDEDILVVLWGDARLQPASVRSSVNSLDVVDSPDIVDEASGASGIGCHTGDVQPPDQQISQAAGLSAVGLERKDLQLIRVPIAFPQFGSPVVLVAFTGNRLATGVEAEGADQALVLPVWAGGFPFDALDENPYPRSNQCTTPSLVQGGAAAGGASRRNYLQTFPDDVDMNLGQLSTDLDVRSAIPQLQATNRLQWFLTDQIYQDASVQDYYLQPQLVVTSRQVEKGQQDDLFLAGVIAGVLGGCLLEFGKLVVRDWVYVVRASRAASLAARRHIIPWTKQWGVNEPRAPLKRAHRKVRNRPGK